MRYIFPSIEISIVRHWQMKKLFYNTKSGLRVFDFCPAGSTDALRKWSDPFNRPGVHVALFPVGIQKVSGYQTGVQFLSDVEFVQILADDDNFSFPISELGVPCLFDVRLVLDERRELSP